MNDVRALARLAWMRMWRGRTVWATLALFVITLLVAGVLLLVPGDADDHWTSLVEITFRSLVLLPPIMHLAPAISEENDAKTYTYLWSRPVRREALLFGKLLAVAPAAAAAAALALLAGYAMLSLGRGPIDIASLARVLLGTTAGVVATSCYALGLGTLFPRHPLVAAMAFIFFGEQILPFVAAIQNLSTLYHVKTIAALPHTPFAYEGDIARGLVGLALLSAAWLGLAVWRIRRLELGSSDG